MSNSENIRILADTAFDSKNFDQAYLYYSKLLEEDLTDSILWVRKGLSAGWCSTPQSPKIDEMLVLIKKGIVECSNTSKEILASQVLDVCEDLLNRLINTIDKEVKEQFDRKPMATGEWIAVHETARLSIQSDVGNQYSPIFIKIRDAIQYSCELHSSANNYKHSIKIIDKFLQHSANNMNYFGARKDAGNRQIQTEIIRSEIITELKQIEPNSYVGGIPQKAGGCFIATATLGTDIHPYLDTFRNFRDKCLLNNYYGRIFVKYYYAYSPSFAFVISKYKSLRILSFYFLISPAHKFVSLFQKKWARR